MVVVLSLSVPIAHRSDASCHIGNLQLGFAPIFHWDSVLSQNGVNHTHHRPLPQPTKQLIGDDGTAIKISPVRDWRSPLTSYILYRLQLLTFKTPNFRIYLISILFDLKVVFCKYFYIIDLFKDAIQLIFCSGAAIITLAEISQTPYDWLKTNGKRG